MECDVGELPGHVNKYDLGSSDKNMESIFGPNRWLWFLPIQTTDTVI
jgi:hypothetical protein